MAEHVANFGQEKIHANIRKEILNQQNHLEDAGVNVSRILKWISKYDGRVLIGFTWLCSETSARIL
jgi:hypothetical protein